MSQALHIEKRFIFEKGHDEGDHHQVSSFVADASLQHMITELQDTQLLARIVGDAQETKYHLKCHRKLRNRDCSLARKSNQEPVSIDEKVNESRAFVELTSCIEKAVDSQTLLFKLFDMHSLYVNRPGHHDTCQQDKAEGTVAGTLPKGAGAV